MTDPRIDVVGKVLDHWVGDSRTEQRHMLDSYSKRLDVAEAIVEALGAMKVYVLLADAGGDDDRGRHQSLGSIHSTPGGAMSVIANQYPNTTIRWEHHDSHGESWYCKFYIAPFWHEFAIVAEEVQTP